MPWLHESLRRKHPIDYLSNCERCMKESNQQTRQHLGCGWEPALVSIRPQPWSPANLDGEWKGEVEVCPGYTTKLPEVIEIARARIHAKEFGGLREFCEGQPSGLLMQGVEILEGASNECQRWAMDNAEKK